ncbi:MAG: class I SAM-dependent methyltransferase [Bifidobacteriaceae bacterium]|jgi:SAM-dependent methyltransferase|nr:class I SAM-dependent methyltransferase [Bifidobacteriaceae bacterium]
MDLADVALLTSAPGRLLLGTLPDYDPALALKLSQGLRERGIDPKLVAAALTQARLRAKAKPKFGPFTDGLLLTEAGAQQATRLTVAAHHAARYRAAGISHVIDLTCGIGADALALAGLGLNVTAVELDPVTAAVAGANLARFPGTKVIQGDALELDLAHLMAPPDGVQAAFADPSRRTTQGGRTFDPAAYSPPLDRLLELRQRLPLGVKVAPGLAHQHIPEDMEAEWTSVDGDVVEAALWSGPLRRTAAPKAALVIGHGQTHRLAEDGTPRLTTGPLQAYLYEPDGAVIRAGLLQQAAATLGRSATPTLISPRIAYITAAAAAPANPFLTGFAVKDSFGFQLKRLKSYLRERRVGRLEILKRGTAVEPAELRRRLDLTGPEAATIVLTKLGETQSVLVVERLHSQP